MIPTIYIDVLFNFQIGLLLALAARHRLRQTRRLCVNTSFLMAVGFEAVFFVPIGAFCWFRQPDWSSMYFLNTAGSSLELLGLWNLGLYVGGLLFGYFLGQHLVFQRKDRAGFVILAITVAALGFFLFRTWRRLYYVDTFEAFYAGTAKPFYQDPLFISVLGAGMSVATACLVLMVRHLVLEGQKLSRMYEVKPNIPETPGVGPSGKPVTS